MNTVKTPFGTIVLDNDGCATVTLEVTPGIAICLLEASRGANVRPLNKRVVNGYARIMESGEWKLTHQGIGLACVGGTWKIKDGQHRLAAVVQSDTTQKFRVSFHTELDDSVVDGGYDRSMAVQTGIDRSRISVINGLHRLQIASRSNVKLYQFEVKKINDMEATVLDAVQPFKRPLYGSAGVLSAMAYAMPIARHAATEFLQQVHSGEMLRSDDPAFRLRFWLEKHGNKNPFEAAFATLQMFHAYIEGRQLTHLNFRYKGNSASKNTEPQNWPTGYRAITTRRRTLGIPNTPGPDTVAGSSLQATSSRNVREEKEPTFQNNERLNGLYPTHEGE